jgi:DNA-directed DNA polymerase III PolC
VVYAELHAVSNFSFLRGASQPEELVARAQALGYRALALTDECSLAGVVRAHTEAKRCGLPLIVGAELNCGTHSGRSAGPDRGGDELKLVALAVDRTSYGALCRLISRARRAGAKGSYRLERQDLENALDGCLILWLPPAGRVALPQHQNDGRWLRERFAGRLWIGVELLTGGFDARRLELLEALGNALGLPRVAAGDVHMHRRSRRALQDVLTAIRLGTPLSEAGTRLHPNGERHLRPLPRLKELYPAALLEESVAVAERCVFKLDELRYEYPEEIVPAGETPTSHLRRLTERGCAKRWPGGVPPAVRDGIEHELKLIAELKFEPFFLTVHDVVQYARSQNILCQGRGSAANSVVCYCLEITEVDPSRMATLFERFISKERNEPPDIDVDFEHERREEVIQYIYRKYGRERAALAATVICYRPRSALRDVGKALGYGLDEVDRLASGMQWWDGQRIDPERIRASGFDPEDPRTRRLMALAAEILGFPRHLSQHVGGFVIARGRLDELVPIENAAMPERTVIEWDKDDLDALGLLKVDVLGLGMLSAIRRAFGLINSFGVNPNASGGPSRGTGDLTLATVPSEDAAVYDMICRADTAGVFQIESRAQMAMLPRLRPRNFYDLVIEVAIVRPGPIQGEMVHPYLRRRSGEEPVSYPSKAVEEVLKRTLGVPIFQEQVMRLAIVAAGFSPGQADELRRAMAAWKRKGGLEPFQRRLVDGMRERGYEESFANQIFNQILGFGEYGFPECVVGETQVVDADTGRWVAIEDLARGRAHMENTLACDEELLLRARKVLRVINSGVKPVLRLRTALGHEICATAQHPFMTVSGWRQLGELKIGDHVATARSLPVSGRRRWSQHKILVLADLIAEGNLCHPSTFYFHTTETWHCQEFVRAVELFPNTKAVVERHKSCFSVRVRRIDRKKQIGAVVWLRKLGVWNCGARAKKLPPEVFELCDNNIGLFLARLWEGDGGFSLKGHASYDTASPQLALQVQYLLLRLGIVARLYRRIKKYKEKELEHQVVTITGHEALCQFWKLIGSRFLDQRKRGQSRFLARPRHGRMSRDILPAEIRSTIRRNRDALGLTWKELGVRTDLSMREIQARGGVKIGFRRHVIERLGEVLGSSELLRLSRSDIYWDRIVKIEPVGDRDTYDLKIEGDHNFVANHFVVHNSHAASFALLVYTSAWLKAYEPAAFCAALINSQPMGFYAPAQLVRDARSHGVEVRPADATASEWDCTLERRDDGRPALRLGLRLVKHLSQEGAKRLLAARAVRPFADITELAERAALDRRDLEALAAADALAALSGHRYRAVWQVSGVERPLPLLPADTQGSEGIPLLRAPREGHDIVADYASLGLTLRRHPLALLRERLEKRGVIDTQALWGLPNGRWVTTAGLVIARQRPGSASGVTFVTLEDEAGYVNLIVWKRVADEQRAALLESRLLEVRGQVQREGDVLHLIARRLVNLSALLGDLVVESRDFH